MTPTITISEEARESLLRQNDPALRELLDEAVRDYSEFWGGLPIEVDAFGDEDSTHVKIYVSVVMDPERGALSERHSEFMRGWRSRRPRETWRRIGFSIHYR